MKKTFALWLSVLLLCLGTTSCSDDDNKDLVDGVYLYTTAISASADAGSQSVTISATTDWTGVSDADWISININKGSTGFTAFSVAWTENTGSEPRIGTVTFTAGKYSEKLTVTQKAKATN